MKIDAYVDERVVEPSGIRYFVCDATELCVCGAWLSWCRYYLIILQYKLILMPHTWGICLGYRRCQINTDEYD